MGAEYQEHIFIAKTPMDLQQQYHEYCEQQAYEYGHGGYTGTFYEKPSGLSFHSGRWYVGEAAKHCKDTNSKWDMADAYLIEPGENGENRYYVGGWCSS